MPRTKRRHISNGQRPAHVDSRTPISDPSTVRWLVVQVHLKCRNSCTRRSSDVKSVVGLRIGMPA
eukprot:5384541-Amphidinium_carterae.1